MLFADGICRTTGAKPMGNDLAEKQCIPCNGGVPSLKGKDLASLHRQLDAGWQIIDEHHLKRPFTFKNFRQALDFTNRVGALAEEQGHHPDIHLSWGKVVLTVFTHRIDGLTESDFIFAAKVDRM
jgi:4a-hydroxytetrahydrobiopterin dehydratase